MRPGHRIHGHGGMWFPIPMMTYDLKKFLFEGRIVTARQGSRGCGTPLFPTQSASSRECPIRRAFTARISI
jgi:hypothetical protein